MRRGWMEDRYNAGLSRESTFLDTSPLSHCPPPNARTKDSEDEKFNSAFKLFSPPPPPPPPPPPLALFFPPNGWLSRTEKNNVGYVAARRALVGASTGTIFSLLIIVTRSIRFRECNETFRRGTQMERRARAEKRVYPRRGVSRLLEIHPLP